MHHSTTYLQLVVYLVFFINGLAALTFNDPQYAAQKWYLSEKPGTDRGRGMPSLKVTDAWEAGFTGQGVTVMVVDDGVYWDNPELNVEHNLCFNVVTNGNNPVPSIGKSQGTMVAGVIAARANNHLCGVGVAYDVTLGGVKLGLAMPGVNVTDAMEAAALSYRNRDVDIYHNSWAGRTEQNQKLGSVGPLTQQALYEGAHEGRNSKGSIYVFAAGNGGINGDRCGYDGYVQSIYTIAVSGVSHEGGRLYSTEPCSAVMVTSYSIYNGGNGIVSTSGESGCDDTLTDSSAAAPLVSGVIALALQANPGLTWREAQHLVTLTSNPWPFKPEDKWMTNASDRRFKVSPYFGFGLVDAHKMVRTAKHWKDENWHLPTQAECVIGSPPGNIEIPMTTPLSFSARDCGHIKYLEHIVVHVNLNFTYRGHAGMFLTSPGGTRSQLLSGRRTDAYTNKLDWNVTSVHFWGERVQHQGDSNWKLFINNVWPTLGAHGVLFSWSVTFYGMTADPNFPEVPPPTSPGPGTTHTEGENAELETNDPVEQPEPTPAVGTSPTAGVRNKPCEPASQKGSISVAQMKCLTMQHDLEMEILVMKKTQMEREHKRKMEVLDVEFEYWAQSLKKPSQ